MKKLLLLFITVLTASFVGAQDFTVGDIGYTITASIAGGDATDEVAIQGSTLEGPVVPSTVDDGGVTYTVTSIGENSFNGNAVSTSLELPSTVTSIANQAFRGGAMAAVTFTTTNSITDFVRRSFFVNPSIIDITPIMSSAVILGDGAFNGTTSVVSFATPSTLTSLGASVFRGSGVQTADLSASTLLTTIPGSTFRDNVSLTSVILSSGTTTIADGGFNNLAALTTLQVDATTPPEVTSNGFNGTTNVANIDLVVPPASLTDYQNHAVWGTFKTINGVTTLSTNNLEQELGFSIYPNPTSGVVSVKSKQLNNANVGVYDLNGRRLLSKSLNGTSSEINISSLASGIYLLKVQVENSEFTKRIVKQ